MYSILIIDDEALTRQTIKKIITDKLPQCSMLLEAGNTAVAAEIIEAYSPDIIISDIMLGQSSGLDLIEAISPASQIIVITGYRDFEYAQKSIELNVSSFLLKPIKPQVLLDAITDAINNIDEQRMKSNNLDRLNSLVMYNMPYIRQKTLLDMFYGITDTYINPESYDLNIKDFCISIFEIEHNNMTDKSLHILQIDALDMLKRITGLDFEYVLLDQKKVAIVLKDITNEYTEDSLRSMYTNLSLELIKKYPQTNTYVGISSFGTDEDEISEKYSEGKRALMYSKDYGLNNIVFFNEVNFDDNSHIFHQEMFRLKTALMSSVDDDDLIATRHYISKIQEKAKSSKESEFDFICLFYKQIFYYLFNVRNDTTAAEPQSVDNAISNFESMLAQCNSISTLNEVLDLLIDNMINKNDDSNPSHSKHVESIIKYISENYSSPITLPDIAAYANLSIEYMCRLFKKKTGKSIVDYINECRVKKAQEILNTKSYKVYEVAEMVGITNPQYFSTMFKKYTGMSPSEYLNK